jgi:glutamyl-tRNA reductase
MRERRGRSMLLVDLAVPRVFDPAINALDGVYLYDIDDLEGVIRENKGARAEEATLAEEIVAGEVDGFCRWLDGLDVVPTVVDLRRRFDAVRERELTRFLDANGGTIDPVVRDAVDRLTRAIVNKILHAPTAELRRGAGQEETLYVEAVRALFRLDRSDPDEEG